MLFPRIKAFVNPDCKPFASRPVAPHPSLFHHFSALQNNSIFTHLKEIPMRRPSPSALLVAASVAAIALLALFGLLARPQALAAGPTVPDLAADTFP